MVAILPAKINGKKELILSVVKNVLHHNAVTNIDI